MSSNAVPSIARSRSLSAAETKLETVGIGVPRYGLVIVLLLMILAAVNAKAFVGLVTITLSWKDFVLLCSRTTASKCATRRMVLRPLRRPKSYIHIWSFQIWKCPL